MVDYRGLGKSLFVSASLPLLPLPAMAAVPLPARQTRSPAFESVWPVATAADAHLPTSTAPSRSSCDKDHRPEHVCCRDLIGAEERTLISPQVARDLIIGLSDGLSVPFALASGLAGLGDSRLVVIGGLAELFSVRGLFRCLAADVPRAPSRWAWCALTALPG